MAKEIRTQWHPAFCSAMRLELKDDAEYLEYMNEYNLNTKPLQMDLLIIKKLKELEIKNEIGKLFLTHNIVEYKSPDDSMNVNTYLKVLAYAYLYKSYEEHVDDVGLNEITITLVRERKPVKLFQWFIDNRYKITKKTNGIFYIMKEEEKEMCQALRELFEPELKEAVQQGMQQGMRNVILKFLNAGSTVGEISKIMEMPLEEVEAIAKGE